MANGPAKVPVLILRAPNYGLVALPDEVLNSFAVTRPSDFAALTKAFQGQRNQTNWRVLGEMEADRTLPPAALDVGAAAGAPGPVTGPFTDPTQAGTTGAHVGKG
jgi:hypothetical protein